MKCQSKANQKSNILRNMFFVGLLISLLGNSDSCATLTVDAVRQEVIRALQCTNKTALTRYNNRNKEFYNLIAEFLNLNNRESCAAHAAKFEAAATQFKQEVVDNAEYAHMKPMLDKLYQDLIELIGIIRRYSNQRGALAVGSFIKELLNYEHMLPADIKTRYSKLGLLRSVTHRLSIEA
jgi:hypothetical protein